MVGFFFYAVIGLAALLLPVFVGADGAFSLDRKMFFLSIRLYGVRILSLKVFLDEKEGILLSVNGKKGKPLSKRSGDGKEKKRNYLPMLSALIFTEIDIVLYVGGEPQTVSLTLAAIERVLFCAIELLPRRPDDCRVEVLPCYVNSQATVKFSIKLFTSIILLLFHFAHTIKGEKDAKRSDRKFDG